MALCVCKCLNVTLESDYLEENVDIGKLALTSMEQRDMFFSEKLLQCTLDSLKIQITQPELVDKRSVGRWTIHSCLACGQATHAISHNKSEPYALLVSKANQTTQERINNLKKSNNFSPVFNLLVPDVTIEIEMKENVDTNNLNHNDKNLWLPTQQLIGALNKQLNQTLQTQLEAIEETVQQFRDQKYAEYEAFRERAHRDHKMLASIVSKARNNAERESWRTDSMLDNRPTSPHLPPLQRRRLSSLKDTKKVQQNIVKKSKKAMTKDEVHCLVELVESTPVITSKGTNATTNKLKEEAWTQITAAYNARNGSIPRQKEQLKLKWDNLKKAARKRAQSIRMNNLKATRQMPPEEDLLDDLFDLEGADSQNHMFSDQEDNYDSDQESNDEGIHISRPRGGGVEVIARSLPMNMPKFPNERLVQREFDEDEEPQDIAASIKALARSVHGDVFELPRPRFSTQI